jgi:hypothetical protein
MPRPPPGSPIRHGGTVLPTTPLTRGGAGAGGDIETGVGADGTGGCGVGRQLSPVILASSGLALLRMRGLDEDLGPSDAIAAQRVAETALEGSRGDSSGNCAFVRIGHIISRR